MKFGIVRFPGSNSEEDTLHVLREVLGQESFYLWHRSEDLLGADLLLLPGGFSYGDYLRCGAIAKFSPIMKSVRRHAEAGGLVMGICNGFQILQEAGLLPGAMLRNAGLKFICEHVHCRVERIDTPFSHACRRQQVIRMPIVHMDGNFFAPPEEMREIERNGQVLLRYCDAHGRVDADTNPNGSVGNIAGILNREGNVMALMPHPERASEAILGGAEGRLLFESLIAWERRRSAPLSAAG